MRALVWRGDFALIAASSAIAQQAAAQKAGRGPRHGPALKLPQNPQFFGTAMPSVIKATAIVNGDVITADRRRSASRRFWRSPTAVRSRPISWMSCAQQVLRDLIDETLEIQAAKAEKIEIEGSDIDRTVTRVAGNVKQTPDQLANICEAIGSSIRSLRRQIEGEIAWQRLQRAQDRSSLSVTTRSRP